MRLSGWGGLACVAILTVAWGQTSGAQSISSQSTKSQSTSSQSISSQSTGSREFAEQAMAANVAEIKLGELAKTHAQNAAVKQFAQMMVTDHTKAKNDLKQAVKGQGIEEPTQLDAKHQALYDKLNGLKGADFDREYITAMVDGHREVKGMLDARGDRPGTAKGTSGTANSQLDTAVNQWASKALPTVSHHLQRAEEISKQVK